MLEELMSNLTIEIHGTGTHNRGAELMAISIAEALRVHQPDVTIAVAPGFGSRSVRKAYGFYTTWAYEGSRRTIPNCLARFLPRRIAKKMGFISPAAVDVILDASGFAFSDQWGPRMAEALLTKVSKRNRAGQKVVFLPQALGPFRESHLADVCRRLFGRAALVCARDSESHRALKELGATSNARLYPDFTTILSPVSDSAIELPPRFVAIVPNMRMMDRFDGREAYLAFLKHCVSRLHAVGANPVFVLHDANEDARVIAELGPSVANVRVLKHHDPRVLKWILGRAMFVIGSRFHALVSALSQGVPCIGAGWSHKYPELFRDFSSERLLVSDLTNAAAIDRALETLLDEGMRDVVSGEIARAAEQSKERTVAMWREILDVLVLQPPGACMPVGK